MQISKKPRILLLEISQSDAQQVLDKLAEGRYATRHLQTVDPEVIKSTLSDYSPEIFLCSHDLPAKGGFGVLKLLQVQDLDIPFLFLARNPNEKQAIKSMQAGAHDYLSKDDLTRLLPSIERHLREARMRRLQCEVQAGLMQDQTRLSGFISNLPGMAFQIRLTTAGKTEFPYVSEGSWALLGHSPQELEKDATLFLNMIHQEDLASYNLAMMNSAEHSSFWNWEGRIAMPRTGETKWINLRCTPQRLENGDTQWEGVMFNITLSKSARDELRALSMHVQDVREQERLNISREVHDNLGGILTAIKLEVARMNNHLATGSPRAVEISKSVEELVDKCIDAAKNLSRTLRPSILDSFGIVAAIEMEIDEFRQRTGIQCEFTNVDEGEEPDPEFDIALFRIFQEALTNIVKHAQATQVKVNISNRNREVSLTVSDNGCGFDEANEHKQYSFGLRGIRERVAYLGGTFEIRSAPGMGTTIAVSIRRHAPLQPGMISPYWPLPLVVGNGEK